MHKEDTVAIQEALELQGPWDGMLSKAPQVLCSSEDSTQLLVRCDLSQKWDPHNSFTIWVDVAQHPDDTVGNIRDRIEMALTPLFLPADLEWELNRLTSRKPSYSVISIIDAVACLQISASKLPKSVNIASFDLPGAAHRILTETHFYRS